MNKKVPAILYHGTDKKIIDYSEVERSEIQGLCTDVSNYLYQLFRDDGLSISTLFNYKAKRIAEIGDCWYSFLDAFQKYDSRKKGSHLYQYGSLYLTGDREKAAGYAKRSFIMGEQGNVAYWLFRSASKIWNMKKLSPSYSNLFERFEKLTLLPRFPIILSFDDIMFDDLLSEEGVKLSWEMCENLPLYSSFRLKPDSKTSIQDGRIEYII